MRAAQPPPARLREPSCQKEKLTSNLQILRNRRECGKREISKWLDSLGPAGIRCRVTGASYCCS